MGLYLVPASRENIIKTIVNDVDISVVEQFLIPSDMNKLKELLEGESRFHCWAMTESMRSIFDKMLNGDIVLLAETRTGLFKYSGEVFFTVESEELGNYLWTYTPAKPWKLIYFLRNIKEINIEKQKLLKKLGYQGDKKDDQLPGTRRAKEEFVHSIMKEYGSIQSFLDTLLKEEYLDDGLRLKRPLLEKPDKNIPIYVRPEWLFGLIKDIEILQNDYKHKERAHESLVESFYELLGFKKFTDIKHRQGRIDISVEIQGKTILVNEVKKVWNLSCIDKSTIIQAYNYSLESGARFVVVTNGDNYKIYDKDKGRSYESHLVGDFQLSRLRQEDLKLIDFLKKENIIHLL